MVKISVGVVVVVVVVVIAVMIVMEVYWLRAILLLVQEVD